MKKKTLLIVFLLLNVFSTKAQQYIPSITINDLHGAKKNILDVLDTTKTTVLIFWATWSHVSQHEIENFIELESDLSSKYNAEVVLINVDDARSSSKILPMVNGKSWSFRCFLDVNSDLKRALSISNIPSTVIVSPALKIFWKKIGYAEGDEATIIEKIKEIK